jgi:hypothetical protein
VVLVTESDTILSLTSKPTTKHQLHHLQLLVQNGDSKTHRWYKIGLLCLIFPLNIIKGEMEKIEKNRLILYHLVYLKPGSKKLV